MGSGCGGWVVVVGGWVGGWVGGVVCGLKPRYLQTTQPPVEHFYYFLMRKRKIEQRSTGHTVRRDGDGDGGVRRNEERKTGPKRDQMA